MAEPIVWMSTPAAAKYLGVNTRTIYRLIDEGELPAHKIGRVIRLQEADVVAFVEKSRIVPGTLEHLYPEPTRSQD
jgi:excisionase family DNA binding protein